MLCAGGGGPAGWVGPGVTGCLEASPDSAVASLLDLMSTPSWNVRRRK